jgi:ferric-dicitrate binding protein FerR (iron transport regulator)
MEKRTKDLLRKADTLDINDKERQEMLGLFHIEDLEFEVKSELTNILDNTEITCDEERELSPLFEKIWKIIRNEEIKQKEVKRNKWLCPLNIILKVAASLFLGLVIGKLVFTSHKDPERYFYTSIAPKGSVSQVLLPDSSIIYLNSGSTIKYTIDGDKGNREVYLTGEAWFNVHKSEQNPFVVHTQFYDVNVTGTEFNVKAYDEDPEVVTTIEKGTVMITSGGIGLDKPLELEPGEQMIYSKGEKKLFVKNVRVDWFTSWKENKLIFINKSLGELVEMLERKYGVDINIEDPKITKYHYDGTFKNESIIEVMDLLKLTLPIDYKINDQIIEIRRK